MQIHAVFHFWDMVKNFFVEYEPIYLPFIIRAGDMKTESNI